MASTQRKTEFGEAEETARTDDVMDFLIYIATVHQMYAAFNHSKRGAVITVVSMIVGAALLGPVGLAVGGALGVLVGWMTSGQFKSVPQVLMKLPAAEKQKLCAEAMAVVKYFHWTGPHQLIELVMSNSILRDNALGVLTTFLTKDLDARIKYGK
ncbi:protein C19orf12 homolog [Passer domesticus]|uniref:protein C19orf12 homolog n=1 Tax=Passer domesticus TaxID=48849 RepID=UPI0030FE4970